MTKVIQVHKMVRIFHNSRNEIKRSGRVNISYFSRGVRDFNYPVRSSELAQVTVDSLGRKVMPRYVPS